MQFEKAQHKAITEGVNDIEMDLYNTNTCAYIEIIDANQKNINNPSRVVDFASTEIVIQNTSAVGGSYQLGDKYKVDQVASNPVETIAAGVTHVYIGVNMGGVVWLSSKMSYA